MNNLTKKLIVAGFKIPRQTTAGKLPDSVLKPPRWGEEVEIGITFDMKKLSKEQLDKLFQAEKLLHELGVSFDTGAGGGGRDWEWDWSLDGPVKVIFRRFVKDDPENRYIRQTPAYKEKQKQHNKEAEKNRNKDVVTPLTQEDAVSIEQKIVKNLMIGGLRVLAKAEVFFGNSGIDKSMQKTFEPVTKCCYCKEPARIAFVMQEQQDPQKPNTETEHRDMFVSFLHKNELSGGGPFWPHDAISVALYFCTKCAEPTALYNQA